jgi:hypothetical protein
MTNRTAMRGSSTRRVGVELEFAGLDIDAAARAVVHALGGSVREDGDYRRVIEGTTLGRFVVELDFELLQSMNARRRAGAEPGVFAELSEELLAAAATPVVPVEVISPPLAVASLEELDVLTHALRAAGATGTRGSLLYAFGLHLNPELERIDAPSVLAHLRAYLCLYDWLVERERVDWKRRLTPYINPFPKPYARLVLAADYAPDLSALIDDYLRFNPQRNRSLDLLPLFSHVDPERVRRAVNDPRIKARSTFHYRLPNCEIETPGWSVLPAWRGWLQVEALAAERTRLARVSAALLARLADPMDFLAEDWVLELARRVDLE